MIAGVILAAGASTRMGRPKTLLALEGRPVLQHVIDAAADAGLESIVVVLGDDAEAIRARLDLPPATRIVVNREAASGQASSLGAGIRALGPEVGAALILLGDQPTVASAAIRAAVEAYERTGGPIVRTLYRGRPGHPVLIDASLWPDVLALEGDAGAREIIEADPDRVVTLERDEVPPADLDTPADYERLIG